MPSELERAIAAQPDALTGVLALDLPGAVDDLADARRVWLVGTGTSQHAAELGAGLLAEAGLDARAVGSAAFARWTPAPDADDAVIVLSHTGETAYARRARARAQEAGAQLLSVTAQGGDWPEAIGTVPRERSETYSASYTAALLLLARIAGRLGAASCAPEELNKVPGAVAEALAAPALAADDARLTVLVGAGPCAVTAREGALKLREAARVLAEGYDAESLLHGHAVPLRAGDRMVLVGEDADPDGLVGALGLAAAAEGLAVSGLPTDPRLGVTLAQIPLTVRLQRHALDTATATGADPDTVITGAWADNGLWLRGAPAG